MLMLIASLALSACSVAGDGSKPLNFDLRGNDIIVPVSVSGAGPFRFLLDTGASRSVISDRVARSVHAVTVAKTLMVTPSGHTIHPTAAVDLEVGVCGGVPVTATVVAHGELNAGGTALDGIVGQDVLSPLAYTIDYRRRTITWGVEAEPPSEFRVPLELVDGRALVTIASRGRHGEPLRLIPDTGADVLVLFARRGRVLPPLTPRDIALLRTVGGQQVGRAATLDRLRVGAVDLRDQLALVLEGDGPLPPGDGLLPLYLFSRVFVNGPRGYMAVER
jgi:predicted aspartyl protease